MGEVHTGFWWGDLRERDNLGDLGIDEYNIKLDLQKLGWGGMEWIGLAQDRAMWWALVNAGLNPRVPKNAGNFLTS